MPETASPRNQIRQVTYRAAERGARREDERGQIPKTTWRP